MHANADRMATGITKTKARRKTIRKLKIRTRQAKVFNAKNLASHMKELLDDHYIENVLRFYTL